MTRPPLFALACLAALLPRATLAQAAANATVGAPAPELSFVAQRGLADDLDSLTDLRGAAVLLEVCRTWCGPCRAQIEPLDQLHAKYAERGLVVLAVTDEDAAKVDAWIRQNDVAHAVARTAKRGDVEALGVRGFPTAVLVAPDGTVAWTGHPGQLAPAAIEKLLADAVNPFARLADRFAPVQDLLDRGQRGRALAMLRQMLAGKAAEGADRRAAAVAARLERAAERREAHARGRESEPDTFGAALLWHELAADYAGHEAGARAVAALERLRELAGDDDAQRRGLAAAAAIARARTLAAERRYDEAMTAYREACIGDGTTAQELALAAIADLEQRGLRGYDRACPDCTAAGAACAQHRAN